MHQSLVLDFGLAPQIIYPIGTETTSVLYEEIFDGFVAVFGGVELLLAHHREVFVVNLSEIHHRGLQQSDDGLVNVVASNRLEFARQRCDLSDCPATAAAIYEISAGRHRGFLRRNCQVKKEPAGIAGGSSFTGVALGY